MSCSWARWRVLDRAMDYFIPSTHRLQCSGENLKCVFSWQSRSYIHTTRNEQCECVGCVPICLRTPPPTLNLATYWNVYTLHSRIQNDRSACDAAMVFTQNSESKRLSTDSIRICLFAGTIGENNLSSCLCVLTFVGRTKRQLWEMLNTCLEYYGSQWLANKFGSGPTT